MSKFYKSFTTPISPEQRKHLRQLVVSRATERGKDIRLVWKELHEHTGKTKVESYTDHSYGRALNFFK